MKKRKPPEEYKKSGKPTIYNEELANKICELVASSPLGTNKLCKMHDWMPNPDTIYKWRYRHSEFADKYALAKSYQAELMVEDVLDISDDGINDTYVDDEGNVKTNTDVVQRSRLRVDTRKWYASKLAPKIYGDGRKVENLENDNHKLQEELKELRAKLDENNEKEY